MRLGKQVRKRGAEEGVAYSKNDQSHRKTCELSVIDRINKLNFREPDHHDLFWDGI